MYIYIYIYSWPYPWHISLSLTVCIHGSSMGRLLSRKQGEIAVGTAKQGLRKDRYRYKEMDSPAPFSGYTNRDVI